MFCNFKEYIRGEATKNGNSSRIKSIAGDVNITEITDPKTGQVRKKYIQKLVPMFSKYKKILSDDTRKASCDDSGKDSKKEFHLLVHQQVVRDYLNLFSPYRGLLLYHGLGSGKTCSSIAIAEGMKSGKKIYVLTLASLKANFFEQLKEWGFDATEFQATEFHVVDLIHPDDVIIIILFPQLHGIKMS